jgi:peroxiredoxin
MIISEITSSTSILKPSNPAPKFTLHSAPDQSIALSQFRGQRTILAFYPADLQGAAVLEGTSMNNVRRGLPLTRAHVEQRQ